MSTILDSSIKFYMQDIGNIPLVTRQEEVELAASIKEGCEKARYKLTIANLRLVVKIAHDFRGSGFPFQDLISEGNIGLMRAVEKFNPEKGAKFSSYAVWWIKQAMRRALHEKGKPIRIPIASAGKINKIKTIRMKLSETLGRDPTDKEISDHSEYSVRVVARLKMVDLQTVSLHEPVVAGQDARMKDILCDERAFSPFELAGEKEFFAWVNALLTLLNKRERKIISMRYGFDGNPPQTLEDVSKSIGRTRERVRQIQNRALCKLRVLISDDDSIKGMQPAGVFC